MPRLCVIFYTAFDKQELLLCRRFHSDHTYLNSDATSGWAGWALAHWNLGVQLTLSQPGGQIMPTTSLLAHPDLKTQRHLCLQCSVCIIKKTKTLWDTVSIENVGVVFKFALIWYVCYYANAKKNRIEI